MVAQIIQCLVACYIEYLCNCQIFYYFKYFVWWKLWNPYLNAEVEKLNFNKYLEEVAQIEKDTMVSKILLL